MARFHNHRRRQAVTTLEAAFVLPVAMFLMIGLIVGALGVFRYQETVYLAREAARYASTHGAQFRKDAGWPIGTSTDWTNDIMSNCVQQRSMVMDSTQLNMTVTWPPVINQPTKPDNWPGSKVRVQMTYNWIPESTLWGAVTFTSTSELPITN
jgi:hypothetical protein